jgi:sirohydrochlorin ferrochelatase
MTGPAPAEAAVALAGHGDRGGNQPNATIEQHRARLAATEAFRSVSVALLKAEEQLEDSVAAVVQQRPSALVIYPYFMADGYFVNQVLKRRVKAMALDVPVLFTEPLGLDPRLPGLIAAAASKVVQSQPEKTKNARLLIVGHGSKISRASAIATEAVASSIRGHSVFKNVETAFLEEAPFLTAQLTASQDPTLVSGFFSSGGMHGAEDVASAIVETGVDATYIGPVGTDPEIASIIRQAIFDRLQSK